MILRPPIKGEAQVASEQSGKQGATRQVFSSPTNWDNYEDYAGLGSELRKMGGVEIMKNVWIVKADFPNTDAVRRQLQPRLDKSDRLFVTRFVSDFAWQNLLCGDERVKLFRK